MPSSTCSIQCLGALRPTDPILDRAVGRGLARELLGVLVAERGSPVPTAALVADLWPHDPPATAPTMVHGAVRRLRRALGEHAVATTAAGYALDVEAFEVDLWALEDLLAAGRLAEARHALVEPLFGAFADRGWAVAVRERLAVALAGTDVGAPAWSTPPLTRLIGRRRELAAAREALERTRLVTLVGMGGVGKSRLATEVVVDLRRGSRDLVVRRVDLGRGKGPVPARMLEALGAIVPAGLAPGAEAAVQALTALLTTADVLVVDGAEHDLDGCADCVAHLLARNPHLRVLASSRRSLGLPGEHVVPVVPFESPEDPRGDAVELLLDRIRSKGLPLTAGDRERAAVICARCAGVPLAIELAAAELLGGQGEAPTADPGVRPAADLVVRSAVRDALVVLSARGRAMARRVALMPAGVGPQLAALLDPFGRSGAERELLTAGMLDVEVVAGGRRYHLPDTLRDVLVDESTDDDVAAGARALEALGTPAMSPYGASALVEDLVPALAEIPNSFAHLDRLDGAEDRLRLAMHYRGAWAEDGHWSRGEDTLLANLAALEAAGPVDGVRRAEVVAAAFNLSGSFEAHARLLHLAAPAAEAAEVAGRLDLVVLLRYAQAAGAGYLGRSAEAIDAAVRVRAAADRSDEELLVLRADALDALGKLVTGSPAAARDDLVVIADRCRDLGMVGTAARVRFTAATAARVAGDLDLALADCRAAEEEAAAGRARANLAVIRGEVADLRRALGADAATMRAAYQAAVDAATAAGQLRIAGIARLRMGTLDRAVPVIAHATLELLAGDHKMAAVGLVHLSDALGGVPPWDDRLVTLLAVLSQGPGAPLSAEDAALLAGRMAAPPPATPADAAEVAELVADLEPLAAVS